MIMYHKTVLIGPEPLETASPGGIFIVTNQAPKQRTGIVKAAGPGCDTVKPGQRVLYLALRAVPIDDLHLVNEEDDILAIL